MTEDETREYLVEWAREANFYQVAAKVQEALEHGDEELARAMANATYKPTGLRGSNGAIIREVDIHNYEQYRLAR